MIGTLLELKGFKASRPPTLLGSACADHLYRNGNVVTRFFCFCWVTWALEDTRIFEPPKRNGSQHSEDEDLPFSRFWGFNEPELTFQRTHDLS